MIDEASRRRPDWVEGEPVTLADGQTWHLPKPVLFSRPTRFVRKMEGEGEARQLGRPVALDGDPFFNKIAELIDARDEVTYSAAFVLFSDLMTRNYDLADAELADLLPWIGGQDGEQDVANRAMWIAAIDVATGRAPKTSPVGTSS